MQHIQQIGRDDCGIACLKMMLSEIHHDQNYLFIPQDEEHGPYSFKELIQIGAKFHLHLSAIQVDEKQSVVNCSTFPFIALIEGENKAKHMILVKKIKRKTVYYNDPASGMEKMKLTDFIEKWSGYSLIIEHFEKSKCSLDIVEPIGKKERLMMMMIQSIALVFAFFGVYTLSESYHVVIPVLFFVFSFFGEIVFKVFTMQQMKKLDDYFFLVDNLPSKGLSTYFQRYEEYKKNIFSLPVSFVLSLIVAIGLMIIIIMNDINNYLLVAMPLCLGIIQFAFINPYFQKKERYLANQESHLQQQKDREIFTEEVEAIHKKAYDLSFKNIINTVGFALVMVIASILTMVISGLSSFPFILFNSCLEFALYRSLTSAFSYPQNYQKFIKAKIRLNNMFYFQNKNNSQKS